MNNSVYEGEFKNDLKDGYGIEKYSDGSIYKGYFKEGLKDGKGILMLKGENNSKYEGEFKKNKICGKGKFKWNDKKEYYGEWDNNEISGFGILVEENVKHIGYFKNDKKNGYGASFYPEQSFVLIGKWEDDAIEGPSIILPLNDQDLHISNTEEDNLNVNQSERIVIINKGNIINSELNMDDILEIKNSNDYNEKMKYYYDKFKPEYYKNINK